MTSVTVRELLDFADELGERFPDLSNDGILLACEEYRGQAIYPQTFIAEICICAYDQDAKTARRTARDLYGMMI